MKSRLLLLVAVALLAASCDRIRSFLPDGLTADPSPPPPVETRIAPAPAAPEEPAAEPAPSGEIDLRNLDALESERVICEEKGGRWSRVGSGDTFTCVLSTRDANRSCTNADECEGYCLARSRTCAPVTPLYGCNEVLSRTGVAETVCIQ